MDSKQENKFNFSEEETKKEKAVEQSKENLKKDAQGFFHSIKVFFNELLDFRDDTDREATIQAIKNDIPFKGATAWILIFAIFTASIGLNVSSTAVVIGAMLISPLMGPILGVGMSLALNDIDTLKRSLINLLVMILLSLLTAFLYFKLSPLTELTPELESRTKPTILDVLVAIFGGLALIVARTKKGTIASVIFGVAIATALMPPLCTAGYGLAVGNMEFFFGALYLFTINTIFIALSTFLVLKALKFPMLKYANSARRKRIARFASLLAIIVMIPAVWTFVSVLNESNFKKDVKTFVERELGALPNASYIKKHVTYNYNPDAVSTIELTTFGADEIPESTIAVLQDRFSEYSSLKEAKLLVNQAKNNGINGIEYMAELRSRDSLDLLTQAQKIRFLEEQALKLAKLERHQIPLEELLQELKINYESVEQFSYSNRISSNFKKLDTLAVFTVKWKDSLKNDAMIAKDKSKLERWLKTRLKLDTLVVESIK
ncbi:MAG: DUF389 domain-containing protein [Gelidibacter sp.]|nr:DUF389 domain-containing protein [Gelidibacter sp.]